MKRKSRKQVVLQTTAMLDVIFILLVFFVAVSKVREGELDLRLPDVVEKGKGAGASDRKSLVISVDREDRICLNGVLLQDDTELRQKLAREDSSGRVLFAADRDSHSGPLVGALKAVTDSGFHDVSFLYDPKRGAE